MTNRNPAENIFNDALAIDEKRRTQFLNDACGNNTRLRAEVEELIQAHFQLGSFMQIPAIGPQSAVETPLVNPERETRLFSSAAAIAGDQIGPYILREQIGEGGFGLVFVAEQFKPVRRKLALKIIKPGMDSEQIIARFSAERQALALMEHPNIAKVFDAGTTDAGQPYFAMELVHSIPITEYCNVNRLSIERRLKLFMKVCKALEHAHQKGIIHRDIKPANVLVASHDDRPLVKVIDFGVAKALHQQLSEQSVYTHISQVVGTPLYMSPEQSDTSNLDIDTRSDIYSLGILLYELLTGTTPLDRNRMKNATFEQIRKLIRDEELTKPSSRLTESVECVSVIAQQRQSDPLRLQRLIRGDLDWITTKCLEKDRSRRYDSAGALSDEIERYLNDQPVIAGPPTASYRLKKLAARHRAALVSATLMLLMLLIGLSLAIWQAYRATQAQGLADRRLIDVTHERDAKETARKLAIASAESERAAKEQSNQRLAHLEETHEILTSIFDELDPQTEGTNKKPLRVTLGDRLTDLLSKLGSNAEADRLLVAEQQYMLGRALRGLGHYDDAALALEQAYEGLVQEHGEKHLETYRVQQELGDVLRTAGHPADGLVMLQPAAAGLETELGPDDPVVLDAKMNLGWALHETGNLPEAKTLLEETLARCTAVLGIDNNATAVCMSNLAYVYAIEGLHDKSAELYTAAIKAIRKNKGEDHPETLLAINNLAGVQFKMGEVEEAAKLIAEALEIQKRTLGEDHADTLLLASNLGAVYQQLGNYDKAISLAEFVYDRRKSRYGEETPDTLIAMRSLGIIYRADGKVEKAISILEEVSVRMANALGTENRHTLGAQNYLGETYIQNDQLEKGITLLKAVAEKMKTELGPQHAYTLTAISNLVKGYKKTGQYEQSRTWLEELVSGCSTTYGPEHQHTILSKMNLVFAYFETQDSGQAEQLLTETYPQLVSKFGVASARVCKNTDDVAKSFLKVKKPELANKWFDRQINEMRKSPDTDQLVFAERLAVAGEFLLEHAQVESAVNYLRESNELFKKFTEERNAGDPASLYAKVSLGLAIYHQANQLSVTESAKAKQLLSEAEKLLISGFEGLHQDASVDNPELLKRTKIAATRLVEIFSSDPTKTDLAAEWQQTLDGLEDE